MNKFIRVARKVAPSARGGGFSPHHHEQEDSMFALTVRQPYASLLVLGFKEIECRSWPTRHRDRCSSTPPPSPTPRAGASPMGSAANQRSLAGALKARSMAQQVAEGDGRGETAGGVKTGQVYAAPPPRRERISNHNWIRGQLAGFNRTLGAGGRVLGRRNPRPPFLSLGPGSRAHRLNWSRLQVPQTETRNGTEKEERG